MKKSLSIKIGLFACALCALFQTAQADEAARRIKQGVEAKLGGNVASVVKTPYLGLYEVLHGNKILYTDENLSVFMIGPMIDAQTLTNLTNTRLQTLLSIDFSKLPFNLAIKQVRGNGKHVVATFEDPNCGFCKRLANDIAAIDNVTIYTFLYPILSQDSIDKSKMIWCSKNKAKAWADWMQRNTVPSAKGDCDTSAIVKSVEIGRSLAITGVPAIFFADGQRVTGIMPVEQFKQKLLGAPPDRQPAQPGQNP